MPAILGMRERAEIQDAWLRLRLDNLVPELMRREGIDMWILVAREYNEDPVVKTMLPATWLAARRRTILMFHDHGPERGVERLAISRYDIGEFFEGVWDPERQPDQWLRLHKLLLDRKMQRIALSTSGDFALADGLSHSEYESLREAVPKKKRERIVSGERLAIGWLETRTPEELDVYPTLVRIAHLIIAEGLSSRVIQPGVTTTDGVEWWFRDRIRSLGLTTWFHPSVSVQRADGLQHTGTFAKDPGPTRVRRGDLVHVDLGITYLGLNTDTQQHAYVLRMGETEAPGGLQRALGEGNRMQDIFAANFVTGRTGNEILAGALEQAQLDGVRGKIYTHPLGFHGHGAGPTIGLWDQQGGVPGRGDYPLYPSTCYAIELGVTVPVAEWNTDVQIMLEEDALFDGEQVRYLDGRQTELLLIE